MTNRTLDSLPPTETLDIETGLSLTPRVKLLLTVHHADHSVKPLDEWKLKRSLIDFLRASFSVTLGDVRKFKDAKKRKREDSVARGALFIRDLGFLSKPFSRSGVGGDGREGVEELERKFVEWWRGVVEKMDGIELNLEGVKFRLSVAVPVTDDFDGMILFLSFASLPLNSTFSTLRKFLVRSQCLISCLSCQPEIPEFLLFIYRIWRR